MRGERAARHPRAGRTGGSAPPGRRGEDTPAALHIQPNRLEVEPITTAMTLEQAVRRAGPLPVPLLTVAFVNNLQPNSNLPPGFQLKLIRGNFQPPTERIAR